MGWVVTDKCRNLTEYKQAQQEEEELIERLSNEAIEELERSENSK